MSLRNGEQCWKRNFIYQKCSAVPAVYEYFGGNSRYREEHTSHCVPPLKEGRCEDTSSEIRTRRTFSSNLRLFEY